MAELPEGWKRHGIEPDATFYVIQLVFLGLIAILVFARDYSDFPEEFLLVVRMLLVIWVLLLVVFVHGLTVVLKRDLVDFGGGCDRRVKITNASAFRKPRGSWERYVAWGVGHVVDEAAVIARMDGVLVGFEAVRSGRASYIGNRFKIWRLEGVQRGLVEAELYPLGTMRLKLARDAVSALSVLDALVNWLEKGDGGEKVA